MLDYIKNTDEKSISVDGFKHLAERIRYLKNDEKGVNYMCALMEQERVEGRTEGRIEERKELIIDFLNDIGKASDGLKQKVLQETDFGILGRWVHLAAKAESISAFEREM